MAAGNWAPGKATDTAGYEAEKRMSPGSSHVDSGYGVAAAIIWRNTTA